MLQWRSIKRNLKQINALVERNIYIEARFKTGLFLAFFRPFLQILMPLIVFGTIFTISEDYQLGYWESNTFLLFIIIAFCIQYLRQMITRYVYTFQHEKYWKTLQALMVAPLNYFNILIGFLISELVFISIPISFFLILGFILFPISFFQAILVIIMILVIAITFGCIGLIMGILVISREGLYKAIDIGLTFIIALSCISYPLQIFPEFLRIVIIINPLYYLFDLVRLVWLLGFDSALALNFITPTHIIIVTLGVICLPIIAIYLFKTFYKKYGITGY
ncbi:MAG: ABC transporter permease [Promethearchaeota archaeon]